MVLPLLHGAPHSRGGRAADQTLEGDDAACGAGAEKLRGGGFEVPAAPTAGAAALGV